MPTTHQIYPSLPLLKHRVLQLLLHGPDIQRLLARTHGLDVGHGAVFGCVEEDVDFFEGFVFGFDPEEGLWGCMLALGGVEREFEERKGN